MKFLNDFKNLFAIVGVVSVIFWTCASESTSDTTNVNPPQLTGGTYQVSFSGSVMVALNSETGFVKTYTLTGNTNNGYSWEIGNNSDLTLTH
jgi:hypothetical protein